MCDFAKCVLSDIDSLVAKGDDIVWDADNGLHCSKVLSNSTKTLIAAYFLLDEIFPMNNLSERCAKYLVQLSKK